MTILTRAFALFALLALPFAAMAEDNFADHRLALQISDNSPQKMNTVLNVATNVTKHYESLGETVDIRIVAFNAGLHMLREDTSPVSERVAAMSLELPNLSFAACGNTHNAMSQREGAEVELLSEAELVQSGVVELIELQKQGWAYVRP